MRWEVHETNAPSSLVHEALVKRRASELDVLPRSHSCSVQPSDRIFSDCLAMSPLLT